MNITNTLIYNIFNQLFENIPLKVHEFLNNEFHSSLLHS